MHTDADHWAEAIRDQIRQMLGSECLRMTPSDLIKSLKQRFQPTGQRKIKGVIAAMVNEGELTYSHHFSASHLELSSSGIRRVSERLTLNLRPRRHETLVNHGEIRLHGGSAFGGGDHPTTLLALDALDRVSARLSREKSKGDTAMLDIGTGTGVLAIAAASLRIRRAVGLDIDRLACHEAAGNVRLNGLASKVAIIAGELSALKAVRFEMIAANLRPPTLMRLMPEMALRTAAGGYWILSGFRPEEMPSLQEGLPDPSELIWKAANRNWAAVALQLPRSLTES